MTEQELIVKNLSFCYEKGQDVLKDISFCAAKGESIGLAGANGVGKSTLLKLLAGLYLNYTGEIRIGGLLAEKKNLPAIRAKLGYVFQDSDSQLFMSTVMTTLPLRRAIMAFPKQKCVRERKKPLL